MKITYRYAFTLLVLLLPLAARAQLTIEITQGVDDPVSIAVVPFEWQGFGTLPENVTEVITNNLRNSGEFAPIDERNMLSLPHESSQVFYRDWRFLGTDYLLVGKILNSENSGLYQVQYELFDVVREQRMVGEVISGDEGQLRDIAHQISDVVFEEITGVRGAFATKILYVTSQFMSPELTYYQLNIADADGGRPQVLLQSEEPIMSPAWSPDASRIAYVSFESTRPRIYIQDLASGEREQVTDYPGINSAPTFSPDGDRLAMVLSKDGNTEIYVMDLDTKDLTRVTNHFAIDTEPSWMPDGDSLLFTSERGGSGRPQIYEVDLRSGFVERVTFDGAYNTRPRMLPDGMNMILVHRDDSTGRDHISLMNLERGTIRSLTETNLDESPTIAPNASMVLYATKDGDRQVLSGVSIDGRVKFQLPSAQGDVREPAWSPFLN